MALLQDADLWGLNPQTNRLYSVQERRGAMEARGRPARSPFGPLPSMMWDEFFNRKQQAESGLPEGPIQGDPQSIQALNRAIIGQAARRKF